MFTSIKLDLFPRASVYTIPHPKKGDFLGVFIILSLLEREPNSIMLVC